MYDSGWFFKMEGMSPEGIEPSTYGLKGRCSTN